LVTTNRDYLTNKKMKKQKLGKAGGGRNVTQINCPHSTLSESECTQSDPLEDVFQGIQHRRRRRRERGRKKVAQFILHLSQCNFRAAAGRIK
jgi:hypothetical protein